MTLRLLLPSWIHVEETALVRILGAGVVAWIYIGITVLAAVKF